MSEKTALVGLLCKDLAALAACVDLISVIGLRYRTYPSIAPSLLRQFLPKILRRAAEVGAEYLGADQIEFMNNVAAAIGLTNAPVVGDRT